MRGSAFTVLGLLGPAAKPAVPGLLMILTNAAPDDVRFDTVWALGKIDPSVLVYVLTNTSNPTLRASLSQMVDSEIAAAAGLTRSRRKVP